jgi:radical SAM protein with 4Fe4S-binding SPASM domain
MRKKVLSQISSAIQHFLQTEPVALLPAPGLYHYLIHKQGYDHHAHLRIEHDGNGVLFVDANSIIHLNASACAITFAYLNHQSKADTLRFMRSLYGSQPNLEEDYDQTIGRVHALLSPEDHCPVCDLGLELTLPFSTVPMAPYRMDLAVTYRCNNNCAHCYNARSRSFPEMPLDAWRTILDRIWEIGIPHVVFTGGEPTLREDLPEIIAYAQHIGLISGLNTNGRRLQNAAYVQTLVDAGLDHVQITFESHQPEIHDAMVRAKGAWRETVAGIQNAVASPLYVMTNTTMLDNNAHTLQETLEYLAHLEVPTVGLNALIYSGAGLAINSGIAEEQLPEILDIARAMTQAKGQRLIWYTPTQYCHFNPLQFELGVKGCSAARYNMCVEPNGDVLPCQSYYQSLGNLISDPWENIWNHSLALQLRNHEELPAACQACDFVAECGGGCPLARDAGKVTAPVSIHIL